MGRRLRALRRSGPGGGAGCGGPARLARAFARPGDVPTGHVIEGHRMHSVAKNVGRAGDYTDVTELAGDEVSREQVDRVARRYGWALPFCQGRDVLELACGTGPGLGLLLRHARRLVAGDISEAMVARVREHYGERVRVQRMDAQQLPFPDASFDVLIIFEALYYLPDPERFARECSRVLRNGGVVLISNANKDLYDFNPSPYSHHYHGVVELERLFAAYGFECSFWGDTAIGQVSLRQRVMRPVKKAAVQLGLMPSTA